MKATERCSIPAWTDYPIIELGDLEGKIAPLRKCSIVSYDNDKYCKVIVDGIKRVIKRGYLYKNKRMSPLSRYTESKFKHRRSSYDNDYFNRVGFDEKELSIVTDTVDDWLSLEGYR